MPHLTEAIRAMVIKRAKHRCEYCHSQERIVIYLEVDHVLPVSKGGDSSVDNLCYCCRPCNTYKHDHLTGSDPETGQEVPLYHPRRDVWSIHFQWSSDGTLMMGLTPIGRATVRRLNVNRELHRIARAVWVESGWHPPADL